MSGERICERLSSLIKNAVIRKCKEEDKRSADDVWCVYSEKGKLLGRYKTKEEAEERLKQIEMFKHMEEKEGRVKGGDSMKVGRLELSVGDVVRNKETGEEGVITAIMIGHSEKGRGYVVEYEDGREETFSEESDAFELVKSKEGRKSLAKSLYGSEEDYEEGYRIEYHPLRVWVDVPEVEKEEYVGYERLRRGDIVEHPLWGQGIYLGRSRTDYNKAIVELYSGERVKLNVRELTKVGSVERRLINDENVTGDKSKIWGDARNIYGDASNISGDVSNIKGDVSNIKGLVDERTRGDVSNIKGDISRIYGDVSKIRGDVSSLSGDVSRIRGDVSKIGGDVSSLSGDVSNIVGYVAYLKGDVSNIRGDVTNIWGNVSGIKGDVSNIIGYVGNIRGDVNNISGDVSGLSGDVSGLKGDVSGIWGDVTGVEGDVTGLKGDIEELLKEYPDRLRKTGSIKGGGRMRLIQSGIRRRGDVQSIVDGIIREIEKEDESLKTDPKRERFPNLYDECRRILRFVKDELNRLKWKDLSKVTEEDLDELAGLLLVDMMLGLEKGSEREGLSFVWSVEGEIRRKLDEIFRKTGSIKGGDKMGVVKRGFYPGDVERGRANEVWRKEIEVGRGKVIILAAYKKYGEGDVDASVTGTVVSSTGSSTGGYIESKRFFNEDEAIRWLESLKGSVIVKESRSKLSVVWSSDGRSVRIGSGRFAQWMTLPRGWTRESLESFWESIGGSVTKCIEKISDVPEIDDPAAFCASLKDVIEGGGPPERYTYWRGPKE